MGQRWKSHLGAVFFTGLLLWIGGCERRSAPVQAKAPSVASLVPAVTDLLLAMGAGDHLAAVSNFDVERDGIRGLTRVGDYQSTDWEKLSALRPSVMVIQLAEDKVPSGFRQRAASMGIRLVNIHIDRLDDVFVALHTIGEVVGEQEKAATLGRNLHGQLEAVRTRVAAEVPVPTLMVLDEKAQAIVGPRNFLDDLLTIAGGQNLAAGMGKDYPSIDREKLIELNPQAVLQLMPEASPQVVAAARRVWEKVPDLPAVKNARVHIFTDWYVMLPASHMGDLAEQFAAALHPAHAASMPTSREGAP